MSKMSLMDVRRDLAEYCLFSESKFAGGIWREESVDFRTLWTSLALQDEKALSRETSPVHLTASAIVVSADRTHVLMNFHKKHGRWKHFGGHLEASDESLAHAAAREVLEETGLAKANFIVFPVSPSGERSRPLVVKVIGDQATEGAHVDLDVRYLFVVSGLPQPAVSDESNEISWVPYDKASTLIGDEDPCAVRRLLTKARYYLGDASAKGTVLGSRD